MRRTNQIKTKMVQDWSNFVVRRVFVMFFKDDSNICVASQENQENHQADVWINFFFIKSKKICHWKSKPSHIYRLQRSPRWCRSVKHGLRRTRGFQGPLWPDWPALLQTGGYCYHQQKGASFWTQIYNMGLTLVPGVKSLLSTGRGIQETDDAKEAAQCPSTRREPAS